MHVLSRQLTPLASFLLIFFTLSLVSISMDAEYAEARTRSGGRSFKRSAPRRTAPTRTNKNTGGTSKKSSFGRGLAGGLLGGAIGGMLFGSMFGAGGSGMGFLPILLLGVGGYFLYRRFMAKSGTNSGTNRGSAYRPPPSNIFNNATSQQNDSFAPPPPPSVNPVEDGLAEIRMNDPEFSADHFTETASDVFFKIQAGWMRRDLDSYRHLLGNELAAEYAEHFAEMRQKGVINKLESIAVRKVEITDAGSVKGEDFLTILFTANLLDYTVDETTNEVVEGSMSDPVKFAEKWTWARPVNSEDWKLEGIKVVK